MDITTLAQRVLATVPKGRRRLVALAGAPASGKSTLADHLGKAIPQACVVPMDGFHLDNRLLDPRGLRARKGSPPSFDAEGFAHLVERLRDANSVVYPVFDRSLDKAIAGAGYVAPEIETVILEGNYLLHDAPVWRTLTGFWDLSIYLDVPEDELRARLVKRWTDHGRSPKEALDKAETNDLPNARLVADTLLTPDVQVTFGELDVAL